MSDTKRLPLTMQGYLVGRDAANEGDPRLLDAWAERALQAGGWEQLAKVVDAIPHPDSSIATYMGVIGCAAIRVAKKLMSERPSGMPQSLETALIEGWASIRRSREYATSLWLMVDDGFGWQARWLGDSTSLDRGWHQLGDGHAEMQHMSSVAWRNVSPEQQAELLESWPSVQAWHEGAPAPWERRLQEGDEIRDEAGNVTGVVLSPAAADDYPAILGRPGEAP